MQKKAFTFYKKPKTILTNVFLTKERGKKLAFPFSLPTLLIQTYISIQKWHRFPRQEIIDKKGLNCHKDEKMFIL